MHLLASGWFTTNHDLVLTNVVLAVAALATAVVGIRTIKSSNKVAASSERQATATDKTVTAALQQLEQGSEQLRLGEQQLEKEREALAASVRPIVVEVPYSGGSHSWMAIYDTQIELQVAVRNIGNGPAFVHKALLTTGPMMVEEAGVSQSVIPAGEHILIRRIFTQGHYMHSILTGDLPDAFAVGILYCDVGGNQRTQSVVHLSKGSNDDLMVDQVELYQCDESWIRANDPFVSTLGTDLQALE